LGDPLAEIESYIDFAALAAEVDRIAPLSVSPQGGRPPYPTETMVRILVLKRLHNLSDEQMEYQLLDRMSYKRFCGLASATNILDRTTVWTFENRIGEAGGKALFDGVSAQLLKKGFIARGGQIIDATLVPAARVVPAFDPGKDRQTNLVLVLKLRRSISSHSRLAKKLSAIALSYPSPFASPSLES